MTTKTLADKLLIKPNTTLWSSHPDRLGIIQPLPEGVSSVDGPAQASTALIFADDAASIRETLVSHKKGITGAGTVWVAYPKANRTDINRDSLWPILAEHGMRPIGQIALDDTWSAMRFRALRADEPPFTGGGKADGA